MKKLNLFLLLLISIYSCDYDEIPEQEIQQVNNSSNSVLGKKLENPYSVENMRKALISLQESFEFQAKSYQENIINDVEDIQITDYYVRFWVGNNEQFDLLVSDSLYLSKTPLDIEVSEEMNYDLNEAETEEMKEPQWMYTSVDKDYQFRQDIKYEKLEDLFLIEDNESNQDDFIEEEQEEIVTLIAGKSYSTNFLEQLEDKSLELTNNKDTYLDDEINSKWWWNNKPSKKWPSGKILVERNGSDLTGNEPVKGVKVLLRRWFKYGSAYTDSNGYYKSNKGFRYNVAISVAFKNKKGFKIWPSMLSFSSSRYRAGVFDKEGTDITFSTNSVGWRWSTVNNATVQYLGYCKQFDIEMPPKGLRIVANGGGKDGGSSAAPMIRRAWGWIGFTNNSTISTFLKKFNVLGIITNIVNNSWTKFLMPDIIIKQDSRDGTDNTYSTTFHELAHASHFSQVGSAYWIKYINYIITYANRSKVYFYGDGTGKNAGICEVGEMWAYYLEGRLMEEKTESTDFYRTNPVSGWIDSSIFEDIEDLGYTPAEIFSCLEKDVDTTEKLRDRLISKINRNTQDIYNLF